MTGLHWAVARDNKSLAELLLSYHSDATQSDILGRTALYYAVKSNNHSLIKKLLAYRALPFDENFEFLQLSEDDLTQRLIKKARSVILLLQLIKPDKRYKKWSGLMREMLDTVSI